ncbi:hypothetical protein Tco_0675533 [Tanacetum coccineum]
MIDKVHKRSKLCIVPIQVRISQKSQENSQKRASTDTRIRRVQKEAKESKPKPEKSSLSQIQSKKSQSKQPSGEWSERWRLVVKTVQFRGDGDGDSDEHCDGESSEFMCVCVPFR